MKTRAIICWAFLYLVMMGYTSNLSYYLHRHEIFHRGDEQDLWWESRVCGLFWPVWWVYHVTNLPFNH